MRILIFGAGVIGSLYAVRFSLAGFDVTLFARGKRFEALKKDGLQYSDKAQLKNAPIKIINKLDNNDIYDYIFVTVRYDQAESALMDIKQNQNQSKNIITMINTVGYNRWVEIIGNRLIPGFPGAGGDIKEDILYAKIGSKNIQKTIFGEINGETSERIKILSEIFETADIPFEISQNILAFHITHAAVAIANKHFYTENNMVDIQTAKNIKTLKNVVSDWKNNLIIVEKMGINITPQKIKIMKLLPRFIFIAIFYLVLNTDFARDVLLGNHALNARNEVFLLDQDFHNLYNKK
jgi:2-dehydropantoate 2-reductase